MKNLVIERAFEIDLRTNIPKDQVRRMSPTDPLANFKTQAYMASGSEFMLLSDDIVVHEHQTEFDIWKTSREKTEQREPLAFGLDDNGLLAIYNDYWIYFRNVDGEVVEDEEQRFDNKVQAASINPGRSNVLLVYESGIMAILPLPLVNDRDYDCHNLEVRGCLHEDWSAENVPVSVGWGSSATQFKGLTGRQSTYPREGQSEDLTISITWKSDGSLVAVAFFDPSKGRRVFRVFTKHLRCVGFADAVAVGRQIAWLPRRTNEGLIASVHHHDIGFFECNGQYLRPAVTAKEFEEFLCLRFNSSGEIMAVSVKLPNGKTELRLYTYQSTQWHLKSTFEFDGFLHDFAFSIRTPESALMLFIDDRYVRFSLREVVQVFPDGNYYTTLDGARVTFGDFTLTGFPKMTCSAFNGDETLKIKSMTNFTNGDLLVETSRGKFFHLQKCCGILGTYKNVSELSFEDLPEYGRTVTAWGETFVCVRLDTGAISGKSQSVCQASMQLHHLTPGNNRLVLRDTFSCRRSTIFIRGIVSPKVLPVHPEVNKLVQIDFFDVDGISLWSIRECFMSPILKVDTMDKYLLIHASGDTLYIMEVSQMDGISLHSIIRDCTEFITAENEFVVMLSISSRMTIFHVESKQNFSRQLENGACLLYAGQNIVAMMPRGNLEVIYPRRLVMHEVQRLMNRGQYIGATSLLRRHKLSLDLLADHNPAQFIKSITVIALSLMSKNYLVDFLRELQNEDLTETVHSEDYAGQSRETWRSLGREKLPTIEDLMRSFLRNQSSVTALRPTVWLLIKCNEVATALKELSAFCERNDPQVQGYCDAALDDLLRYFTPFQLYCIALGSYDLKLAEFVATRTRLDPQKYDRQLRILDTMEEGERRIAIDIQMRRHDRALKTLTLQCATQNLEVDSVEFLQLLSVVEHYTLFSRARVLTLPSRDMYRALSFQYADHMANRNCPLQAGILYLEALDGDQALSQFFKIHDPLAIVICILVKHNFNMRIVVDDLRQLADKMLITHTECAEEILQTCYRLGKDWENILISRKEHLKAFISAALSESAQSIASIRKHFLDECLSYAGSLSCSIRERTELWYLRTARLFALWRKPVFGEPGEREETSMNDAASTFSSTSTSSSSSSSSAKKARKTELKRYRLKPKATNEPYAIVASLHEIIKWTESVKSQVKKVLHDTALIGAVPPAVCRKDGVERQLQKRLLSLQNAIAREIPKIWKKSDGDLTDERREAILQRLVENKKTMEECEARRLATLEHMDPQYLVVPKEMRDPTSPGAKDWFFEMSYFEDEDV